MQKPLKLLLLIYVVVLTGGCSTTTFHNFDTVQLTNNNFKIIKKAINVHIVKNGDLSPYPSAMRKLWEEAQKGLSVNASLALVNVIVHESGNRVEITADVIEFK